MTSVLVEAVKNINSAVEDNISNCENIKEGVIVL